MHTNDINVEEKLKRLLAEMSENRSQLQSEIRARQAAEMALRDFVASRNAKILQATEDALKSAWEELEEKRRLVKEQHSRIQFLEARLAEAVESARQIAEEPAPVEAEEPVPLGAEEPAPDEVEALALVEVDELTPVEADEPVPVEVEEPVAIDVGAPAQMVLELEEPPEVSVNQAAEEGSASPPEDSQPWFLNKRLHQWLSPGQLSPLSPVEVSTLSSVELSTVSPVELSSGSPSETAVAEDMLPVYQWHPGRPAEADSERVKFLGQSQTKSSLKRFIEEERMACADILDDVNEERHESAEKKVRQLRLAARDLGARELEARAWDVETCLKQGEERIFVVRRVVEMESAMKSLLEEMAELLEPGGKGKDSPPAVLKPGEPALEMVRRMGELLSAGNEEVRAFLDEHPSAIDDFLEPEEREDFIQYVQNGEYDQALQMIEYYL